VLRADGGFLIMYAIEALSEQGVWRALKRSSITIGWNSAAGSLYPFTATALKPESVDLNVKVILIGDRDLYEFSSSTKKISRKSSSARGIR